MITAVTGVPADQVDEADFAAASQAVVDAYTARDKPESGRNMASVFHRLRLTLFHAGRLDHRRRPPRRQPVSVTGWTVVAPGFADNARRYVDQVTLSLRPATVKHIEQHLRVFGTWLAEHHPEVASCADLDRRHIELFKAWLAANPSRRTGIRWGELLELTVDAVVQIGSAFWLRIPVGKLHNDRYIPLHPQLKELLDDWVTNHRPAGVRSNRLLIDRHRPITGYWVSQILHDQAVDAGVGHVTAHQLRHTLATQAINRGMSLDAIAALLGHKTLAMTMVYARIADKTVAEEYFAVTEKVDALYDQPRHLNADDEGTGMRKSAPRCTGACSATATARDPSSWTATSSPSASPARSSSPPSSSDPPFSANAMTPPTRARSAVRRSSTDYSTALMRRPRERHAHTAA
jgi:hypothetical protein